MKRPQLAPLSLMVWMVAGVMGNLLGAGCAAGQDATTPAQAANAIPVEVGTVAWARDFDASAARSLQTGKPMLVLFQEVPGCAGCQQFGREVLSHPLLVEAIESEFVPVLVYNNRDTGTDAQLRERFKEPAWNYQVVRFLNGTGEDIIPRKDRVWSVEALAARMIETLQATKRPVPKYLTTLAVNTDGQQYDTAAFAMHCFWTGEVELGRIEGVVTTEAGWLDGREVTLVKYDSGDLPLETLIQHAAEVKCADKVYTADGHAVGELAVGTLDDTYRVASPDDQKRQLAQWPQLRRVPALNAMQLTKLNALAPRDREAALEWLSPRQRSALD